MNRFLIALSLGALIAPAAAVIAQTPSASASTASAHYTVDDTDVGTLLDDPAAKAVLVKYIPDLANSPQIDMARSLTLKAMQNYAPDKLSDKTLSDVQIALAKLPVKK